MEFLLYLLVNTHLADELHSTSFEFISSYPFLHNALPLSWYFELELGVTVIRAVSFRHPGSFSKQIYKKITFHLYLQHKNKKRLRVRTKTDVDIKPCYILITNF